MRRGHTDLLIDLSDCGSDAAAVETLRRLAALEYSFGAVTAILPADLCADVRSTAPDWWKISEHWTAIASADTALLGASIHGANLLIVLGSDICAPDSVRLLGEPFEKDPHFGAVVPRYLNAENGALLPVLSEQQEAAKEELPRRVLTVTPEYYVATEYLSPCILVRSTVISALTTLGDHGEGAFAAAIQSYFTRMRRCGFRVVINNRVVVPLSGGTWRVKRECLQSGDRTAYGQVVVHPNAVAVRERVSAAAFPKDRKFSLLLDFRDLAVGMNGTAQFALSLANALWLCDLHWDITMVAPEAVAFSHHLRDRFPDWSLIHELRGHFTASLRPCQPWNIHCMLELHQAAIFNYYAFLDSIAWDICLTEPTHLAATWNFLRSCADCMFYNSEYTQRRFETRFPSSQSARAKVIHHSFDVADYQPASGCQPTDDPGFLFVVGNGYDHKRVGPTTDALATAFPFQQIRALGIKGHANPSVTAYESGFVSDQEMESLYAGARLIVFPSLYEGFGFPILKGFAYGKIVLVRQSQLVHEIALHYSGSGLLVPYQDDPELVYLVGQALHGHDLSPYAVTFTGTATPKSWRSIAEDVLAVMESDAKAPHLSRWAQRQLAFEHMAAFHAECSRA